MMIKSCMHIVVAAILSLTMGIAYAQSEKPLWVSSYFSGECVQNGDYEGIAFMEIAGDMPTMQELATVESHAKQVLASRYKSVVQSRIVECLSDKDGQTVQEASYDGLAESSLKMTIAMPVFWHDEDTHMLWAKVSIPRHKVHAWIEDGPLLSMSKKTTQVHGIIYRFVRNEVWIKLEDGRALRFKMDESLVAGDRVIAASDRVIAASDRVIAASDRVIAAGDCAIVVGDRVIVAYDGNRAKEVYCNNVKLEGKIFHNARM